jgi:hypothetical protein
MEIVLPLLIAGGLLWWALWLTVRKEEEKDAANKGDGASGPSP